MGGRSWACVRGGIETAVRMGHTDGEVRARDPRSHKLSYGIHPKPGGPYINMAAGPRQTVALLAPAADSAPLPPPPIFTSSFPSSRYPPISTLSRPPSHSPSHRRALSPFSTLSLPSSRASSASCLCCPLVSSCLPSRTRRTKNRAQFCLSSCPLLLPPALSSRQSQALEVSCKLAPPAEMAFGPTAGPKQQ